MDIAVVRDEISLPGKVAVPHGHLVKKFNLYQDTELAGSLQSFLKFPFDLPLHASGIEPHRIFEC
jgi:hypothetical protein